MQWMNEKNRDLQNKSVNLTEVRVYVVDVRYKLLSVATAPLTEPKKTPVK